MLKSILHDVPRKADSFWLVEGLTLISVGSCEQDSLLWVVFGVVGRCGY